VTPKQLKILQAVNEAQKRGETLTMNRLIVVAGLSSSKQAAQQTLRTLERRGLLERFYERRGERVHLVLRITPSGISWLS
jgi:DNA-binding IclR family transcriptional regulator